MDNNELAKSLTSDVLPLIEKVLLKQRKAELRIWKEEIKSRNRRIRELESLLRRAGPHVDDKSLRDEISGALDHGGVA